jgi:hypothetical protein
MEENKKCDEHKMVCDQISNLKQIIDERGPILMAKVSQGQMWAVVVLFIMISMAIIGWLWHGQISVRDRLEVYQNTLTGISPDGKEGILIRMDKKLDTVGMILNHHLKLDSDTIKKEVNKK